MSLACLSVIEVASKKTALSLRQRLLKGASFAALAKANSVDSSTAPQGGAIGCVPDSELTAPLDTIVAGLALKTVSNPVAFSSDYLLLEVTAREPETYPQLVSSIVGLEQPTLGKFFPKLIKGAKVQLDPQYGTWDEKGSLARVVANPAPPAALVPNPAANAGPTVTVGTSAAG
jgi:parvulin-like peptidyl-prolyl isomerase